VSRQRACHCAAFGQWAGSLSQQRLIAHQHAIIRCQERPQFFNAAHPLEAHIAFLILNGHGAMMHQQFPNVLNPDAPLTTFPNLAFGERRNWR